MKEKGIYKPEPERRFIIKDSKEDILVVLDKRGEIRKSWDVPKVAQKDK